MVANNWDLRFLELAALISKWSKDGSTQCGSVIVDDKHRVISVGYNGFPRGCNDSPDLYKDRPRKYLRVVHAEINALLFAKEDLSGATIYVYPLPPCSQCAAAIIQAGIKRVVTHQPTTEQLSRWSESFVEGSQMFIEAGVSLEYI